MKKTYILVASFCVILIVVSAVAVIGIPVTKNRIFCLRITLYETSNVALYQLKFLTRATIVLTLTGQMDDPVIKDNMEKAWDNSAKVAKELQAAKAIFNEMKEKEKNFTQLNS